MASRVDGDPRLRAYADDLRRTHQVLGSTHTTGRSVETAWNKVQARLDQPAPSYRRRLVQFPTALSAVAAILLLSLIIYLPQRGDNASQMEETGLDDAVYLVETDLENATPIVYIDQPSGWTVVWVAEPQEIPEKG